MIEFDRDYFYGNKKSNYKKYDEIDFCKIFKNVFSFIKQRNLKGRILDAGCAFGFLLKQTSPFFNELYGFDISSFAIEKAKRVVPNANLKVWNIEKPLPYPDRFFDVVTAFDVLEHTKNFAKSFENLAKKLKKDGHMIISTPINSKTFRAFKFLDKDKTHISILREKEIMKIVKKNKLSVLSKKHFCVLPLFYRIPFVPAEVEIILKNNKI